MFARCSVETSRKVRTMQEDFDTDRLSRLERVKQRLDSVTVSANCENTKFQRNYMYTVIYMYIYSIAVVTRRST